MASYKSQSIPPKRMEEQTPYPQRTTSTRLPQRSVTPTTNSQLPVSGHSKLQKKKPTLDEQPYSSRGPLGQRAPVVKPSVVARSRQGSTPTVAISRSSTNPATSKPALQVPSSRLPKLEVPATTRTPSLVSGSSASTVDSPRSNLLRRKQSSIGVANANQLSQTHEGSMSFQEEAHLANGIPGGYKDPFSETVLGISLPPSSTILACSDAEVDLSEHNIYSYEVGPTDILPPPAPQYALSTTPSTRYSESPGPFSVSSTPTSMSSYSPGTVLSSKNAGRVRQASPLQGRPPTTRHRTPEELRLSSVRESSTSSSSASTVLAETGKQKDRSTEDRLPAPPPSPPPHTGRSATVKPQKNTFSARAAEAQNRLLAAESRPPIQAPPELAHLADQPATLPLAASRRPKRPSREGTSDILGLRGPSPVIQSNMSSFPVSHKRTASTESNKATSTHGKTRFGIPSKQSSRQPSPNPSLSSGFVSASRLPARGPTPDTQNDVDKQRAKTLPTPAPTPSPSKTSRFGFFSRRAKTEPVPSTDKRDKKLHRRGPAAGTGHEGYGRYAVRGRSGSSVSATSIGRSASAATTTESLDRTPSTRKSSVTSTSSADMDDFFLERLTPVVIRGTGSSTELSRSPEPMHSTSSLDVSGPLGSELKKTISNSSQFPDKPSKPTLLPSAMSDPIRGLSPVKKMPLGLRRPSESDDDTKRSFIPSLATRRTSRTSKLMDPANSKQINNVSAAGKSRSGSESKESGWLKTSKKDKTEKDQSKSSKRWNFFQRAHAAPRVASPAVEVSTAPARVAPSRSVAHYALIDAQSGIDLEDIEKIMQEADSTPEDLSHPEEGLESAHSDNEAEKKERLQSMLLPPKPVLPPTHAPPARPASPKVTLRTRLQSPVQLPQPKLTVNTDIVQARLSPAPSSPHALSDVTPVTDLSPSSSPIQPLSPIEPLECVQQTQDPPSIPLPQALSPPGPPPSNPPPRPSRLAQVGRIPQVVSRRNQVHRPPSQSFSRPFAIGQPRPNAASRTSVDSIGSLTATAGTVEPYPVLQGLNALSHSTAIATMSPSAEEANRQSEFFKFPPRKDSEVSYSSSSGIWSFPPTAGTAVIPPLGAPQSEDEVWNEYDDLIDEVLSPAHSSTLESKRPPSPRRPSLEPLPLKPKASHASTQSAGSTTAASNSSLHLRRSRLLAVLHSQSPTSPKSLSEFLQDYGERNLSVIDPVTGRLSLPSTSRLSCSSAPRTRPGSTRSSLPASLSLSARQSRATLASTSDKARQSGSSNKYRDTRLMEIAETQADGLVSMANLRFGALMTSKWLSFGRVLFSPAHFELKDPSEDRVLVIDGLGKDWSYYCALTYPEATVYNLGPGPSSSALLNGNSSEPWSTLKNHRHISHQSFGAAFPFPKGFFACAVLRFPPALPSSVHRSILSECKRVLRPGGFLEISVLDLDLVNMGNRARRAVRGLKVKMQVADENVSLRNISDEIMGLLGRKGFTECNRCFVGVPVAGCLPSPEDVVGPEAKKRKGSTAGSIQKGNGAAAVPPAKKPKPEVSFSDLLNTQSSSESTDDSITEMVARVGRWWYSRCYESLVLPEAGEPGTESSETLLESSIWRDEGLIHECEKRGTSFRLLIGYAQKPEVGVRRTVSV